MVNIRFISGLGSNLDPELLQARWVLGGIEPEQFVAIAVSALEQGFDGTALQQLAALSRPTSRDLGTLPERVFEAHRMVEWKSRRFLQRYG
jgi:hypothetical protein